MVSDTKYIDYLEEDDPIPGQAWVCISFVSPEGIKNCSTRGLKIRGVYATREQADKRAEYLSSVDPDFDVFVGEVGKWLPWDPDPNSAEDQVYQEKELNDIVKGYKDNRAKAEKMQKLRKQEMIKNAAREEMTKKDKMKARMRKKLEERRAKKMEADGLGAGGLGAGGLGAGGLGAGGIEGLDIQTNEERAIDTRKTHLDKKTDMAKQERKRLDQNKDVITEKENELGDIDSKLARIQALYQKLNAKKSQN